MVDRNAIRQALDVGLCDGLGCGDVNAYVRQCAQRARAQAAPRPLATWVHRRDVPIDPQERRDLQASLERVLCGKEV